MLIIESVIKKYGKVNALNNISYEQRSDSSIGIIGSNGAGKTTLCMAANGLTKIDHGDIILNNYSVVNQTKKVREMTNLYTEELKMYDELTVKECIFFYKELYKCTNIDDFIYALHINDFIHKKIRTLSTGMRKKVNLLISIMNRPEFLFLDEPFSGLDPKAKNEFVNLLKEIKNIYNTQLIISSHDLYELESSVENVIIMDKGGIIESGNIHNLVKDYFDDSVIKIHFRSKIDLHRLYEISNVENNIYEVSLKHKDVGKFFQLQSDDIQIVDISSQSYSLENLYERVAQK
jgi:ABC-2 type transport system ATP-binding protein